ncbi:hypothetical protein SEVIR_8G075900v4 [Setaria viridis]|uniref:Bifunctional inhibitor/plant lipid transfer protein/seed storage helical domain-containing protein n=1 Tax=Setaria viridis TaxID=4556 RepID=A0A4U6TGF5_SETVI|nr:hypothetical protein SEVIR_8G075900v2 [Setaria viridis]
MAAAAVNKAVPAMTSAALLVAVVLSAFLSFSEAQDTVDCMVEILTTCGLAADRFENPQSMQNCCDLANADSLCACAAFDTAMSSFISFPLSVLTCVVDACAAGGP